MSRSRDTEALIAALAQDMAPVRRFAVERRLILGLTLGAAVTLGLVCAGLGIRPDLWAAMHGSAFWIKWIYTGSLAVLALFATRRLARPDSASVGWLWLFALPVVALAVIGLVQMAQAPRALWLALWLGNSWRMCSGLVFALSLPIFAGLLWSFRGLAPTRLRLAGATAGLSAGAWAATLYCLHCPEVSAIFVLTWYTGGIALAVWLGAWIGPKLMRW